MELELPVPVLVQVQVPVPECRQTQLGIEVLKAAIGQVRWTPVPTHGVIPAAEEEVLQVGDLALQAKGFLHAGD